MKKTTKKSAKEEIEYGCGAGCGCSSEMEEKKTKTQDSKHETAHGCACC